MADNIALKVASANMNQTVVNFTRNMPNILQAIDAAIADGADILSLQELGLTGYSGDDNFKWINDGKAQREMIELLDYIAVYAAERDPNLVISVGFPFFYADKTQPPMVPVDPHDALRMVSNPLYNADNRPFNAVATLGGGSIHCISAKSIQPDGAAEYESRQFTSWPDHFGVVNVRLFDGRELPFGKVVAQLGEGEERVTMYHEICAEGWPGIKDNGTINQYEMDHIRYIKRLTQKQDISLTINPSASKPEPFLNKPELRKTLAETGSSITSGAYVYTNCLGVEAAPAAFEGGSIYAVNGERIHRSARYSMADVVYSSAVMDVPVPQQVANDNKYIHAVIPHQFRLHEKKLAGGAASWEKETQGDARKHEEIVRNTSLWLRDYLNKTGQQGYFISLSGGQDSAFGAVMVTQMIDLNIDELTQALGDASVAVDAFIDQFDRLDYAEEIKQINRDHGAKAAIKAVKAKMLTCAYMPGENSSKATEDAARVLIEGGTLVDVVDENGVAKTLFFDPEKDSMEDGKLSKWLSDKHREEYTITHVRPNVEGIGGTFHVVPVQPIIDTYMEIFAGLDQEGLTNDQRAAMRDELKAFLHDDKNKLSPETLSRIKRRMPSWSNTRDDILLQNIQARARLPVAWLFGNDQHKIACVTSNWSEAVAGYWTFGGDGHMGSINICGGVPKSDLRNTLKYLEKEGLHGMQPAASLGVVNGNAASAELRPLKDGEIAQFDEDDMMPYEQLDAIARSIIIDKNTPVEAYHILRGAGLKYPGGRDLFASDEELITRIDECCWRWHSSQFKRVAAVIAPFLGENVDPHTAVRTTIIGDGFREGRAQLKIEYLNQTLGDAFAQQTGMSYDKMRIEARINRGLRDALIEAKLPELATAVADENFGKKPSKTPWTIGRAA